MAVNLGNSRELADVSEAVLADSRKQVSYRSWVDELMRFLEKVRDADDQTFISREFQRELWESEAISATGMGHVNVSKVIESDAVAKRLLDLRRALKAAPREMRAGLLRDAWNDVGTLIEPLVLRSPRLKKYRVFAAIAPEDFTTVAHISRLRRLARAMGVSRGIDQPMELHRRVLDRLAEALPPVPAIPAEEGVQRMTLPWLLYASQVQEQGEEATETAGASPGEEQLKPLPADRRRRGMLAIAGSLRTVRAMIEFAKDGCKREDFHAHIHSLNPKLAPGSIGTNLNALIAEWGVLRAQGDELFLTPRGEALLETGEPEEVADWLLTRILGFDNGLYALRSRHLSTKEMVEVLQHANPGWTSNFAPTALINWFKGLSLVEAGPDKLLQLTERGREWVARIHWTPGELPQETPKPAAPPTASSGVAQAVVDDVKVSRPPLAEVIATFPKGVKFKDSLIGRLDAGLWSNQRRHFAVLTGLSGAGKTLLARSYALGLWRGEPDPNKGLYTLPVQPGWHDPTSVLGYVNPLNNERYVSTGFLEFLLEANNDPERPYTVLLDEMNLSHPEQYLAPLLSAMETGDSIELHAQGDDVDGIPARIPYPENLLLIGTVNMDETTHGLSDKVLDRAAVVEFWDIDIDGYAGWSNSKLSSEQLSMVQDVLKGLLLALRPVRLHFGFRTIDDVLGYVGAAVEGSVIQFEAALDHAIYAKVLPKLRGEDSPRLQTALSGVKESLAKAKLGESAAKVGELLDDLSHVGSARFWR